MEKIPISAISATDKLLEQVRGIRAAGGFGSIISRNSFTRPKADALKLLSQIIDISKIARRLPPERRN